MAQILNTESALQMVGGEYDLLKELLCAFLNDRPLNEAKLRALASSEDTSEAAQYVHYYKGAGRQIGAEQLGHDGQILENVFRAKAKASEYGGLETLISNFCASYAETIDAIKRVIVHL